MTERHFARTCSCGKRVPAGQRCDCKPVYQPPPQAERVRRQPSRKGYSSAANRVARKVAIQRATGADGHVRCELCRIVVGLRYDRRGRPADYQVHHRDGNPANNPADGSNHMVLCEGKGTNRCHDTVERVLRKARRPQE